MRNAATAGLSLLLALLLVAGCSPGAGHDDGSVSIEEAAELYSNGTEQMRIRGAFVIEYGAVMLCSDVVRDDDPGTPVCGSPAYHVQFGYGLPDVKLEGDGAVQWAEDVSFYGTLDEGTFTIDGQEPRQY